MSRTESHHQDEALTPEVALSPGAQLRAAREARSESVNEVAFALKLHPRQITALEEDNFGALPGEAFVRGFLRNYARYLGLDPAPLLVKVAELGGTQQADLSPIRNADGELPNGDDARRPAVPLAGLIVALLLLLAVGWYFDWFRTAPADEVLEQGQGSGGTAPLLSEQLVHPAGQAEAVSLPIAEDEPVAQTGESAADGVAADTAEAGTTAEAAEVAQPEAAAGAASPVAEPVSPVGQPAARLQFYFSGESWVEVRDGKGAVIHSGVNQPGSSRQIDGEPPFALTIGNAASVRAEFDGKPIDLVTHTKGTVARLRLE